MLRALAKSTLKGQKFNFIPRLCSVRKESSSNSSNAIQNISNIDHFNAVVHDGINVHTLVSKLELKDDNLTTSMLNDLAEANTFNISATGNMTEETSLVQGITLKRAQFDDYSVHSSTIYVRKFYPTLFKRLME